MIDRHKAFFSFLLIIFIFVSVLAGYIAVQQSNVLRSKAAGTALTPRPSITNPFGVHFSGTMAAGKQISLAKNLKAAYIKLAPIYLKSLGNCSSSDKQNNLTCDPQSYATISAKLQTAGLKTVIVIDNRQIKDKSSTPLQGSEVAGYKSEIGQIIDGLHPVLIQVEEKESDPKIFSGTAAQYQTMLQAACDLAHSKNTKCTTGGFDDGPVVLAVYRDLVNSNPNNLKDAKTYRQEAFSDYQENTICPKMVAADCVAAINKFFTQTKNDPLPFLDVDKSVKPDYLNFQWVTDARPSDAFRITLTQLQKMSGLTAISSSITQTIAGDQQTQADAEATTSLMTSVFRNNMPIAIWKSFDAKSATPSGITPTVSPSTSQPPTQAPTQNPFPTAGLRTDQNPLVVSPTNNPNNRDINFWCNGQGSGTVKTSAGTPLCQCQNGTITTTYSCVLSTPMSANNAFIAQPSTSSKPGSPAWSCQSQDAAVCSTCPNTSGGCAINRPQNKVNVYVKFDTLNPTTVPSSNPYKASALQNSNSSLRLTGIAYQQFISTNFIFPSIPPIVCTPPVCPSGQIVGCTNSNGCPGGCGSVCLPASSIPPTVPAGQTGDAIVSLKLAFQGILAKPQAGDTINVKVTLSGGGLSQDQPQTGTFTSDDKGVFSGQVTFTNVLLGGGYSILVKGPKHIQKKVCVATPTETANGTYRCANGAITVSTNNTFDFSGIRLLVGDIPVGGSQDGIIDSTDISYIRDNLGKTDPTVVSIADLNLDGIVDSQDYSLLIASLNVKYDEQ